MRGMAVCISRGRVCSHLREKRSCGESALLRLSSRSAGKKHIEPEIIVAAIEDAMVVAARKYYRTEEDLRSKFNAETGHVDVFSVHMVVDEVSDPLREISLTDARKQNHRNSK